MQFLLFKFFLFLNNITNNKTCNYGIFLYSYRKILEVKKKKSYLEVYVFVMHITKLSSQGTLSDTLNSQEHLLHSLTNIELVGKKINSSSYPKYHKDSPVNQCELSDT